MDLIDRLNSEIVRKTDLDLTVYKFDSKLGSLIQETDQKFSRLLNSMEEIKTGFMDEIKNTHVRFETIVSQLGNIEPQIQVDNDSAADK
jgi:hypothetical protein